MALTLTQHIELVKRLMGEDVTQTDNPIYTDAWITAYLNAGQAELARRVTAPIWRKSATHSTAAGVITLPTDYLCGLAVRYYNSTTGEGRALSPKTLDEIVDTDPQWLTNTVSTAPTGFSVKVGMDGTTGYYVYPQPATSGSNDLFLTYTPKPTDMALPTDTAVMLAAFPEFDSTVLAYYACFRIRLFEGGPEDAQVAKFQQLFDAEAIRLNSASQRLPQHASRWAR